MDTVFLDPNAYLRDHLTESALAARLTARGIPFADTGDGVSAHDPWGTRVTVSVPGTTAEALLAR